MFVDHQWFQCLEGGLAPGELLVREHLAPFLDVVAQALDVLVDERADVDAVDRGHRGDLARAEALEGAHVEVRVAAEHVLDVRVELVRAEQRARDVRAHVHVRLALGGELEHVVEARDAHQVGGRQAQHARGLLHRRRRQPAVLALDDLHRRDRRRSGCPGTWPSASSIPVRTCAGTYVVAGSGTTAGSFVRSTERVPARDARAVGVALDLARIDRHQRSIPPRIGSSIASATIMSAM